MGSDAKAGGNTASRTDELAHDVEKKGLKERAIFEAKKYAVITAYLWALFIVFNLYRAIILEDNWRDYWGHGFAILNALIFGKVILIGDALNIARRFMEGPRIYVVLVRAFLFSLLIVAFRVIEDIIKGALHGRALVETLASLSGTHLRADLAMLAIAFVTLIPFFAFDSIGRTLGGAFWEMLFTRRNKKYKLIVQE
jgi:hypothetical protein